MEPRPLTTWEQKERDGLLALESDAWREKRRIAENPNTTADVLERLFLDITNAWNSAVTRAGLSAKETDKQMAAGFLVAEVLVAHPNTPPSLLFHLLDLPYLLRATRAFCTNPVLPFLVLEKPNFWEQINNCTQNVSYCLLAEAAVPLSVIQTFGKMGPEYLTDAARFHVAVAGEVASCSEGVAAIMDYWKGYCKKRIDHEQKYGLHQPLVKAGLAPLWALGGTALSEPPPSASEAFLDAQSVLVRSLAQAARVYPQRSLFLHFVAALHGVYGDKVPYDDDGYSSWVHRSAWALSLPLTTEPLENDVWDRSPLDLLNHLACDGNRLVRWAAQTRLADPDFVFTWDE